MPINAATVVPVVTADASGQQTVHYHNLWPGVDVAYSVYGSQVKETLTLANKEAASQMAFQVVGATLSKTDAGGFHINGLDNSFSVAPINLILNTYGFVGDSSVYSQSYQDGVLAIAVSKSYLQQLPTQAFPVVIDPGVDTYSGGDGAANYQNVKSDGTLCNRNSCDMYTGGLYDSNGYGREWHNYFYAPYSRYQNTNYRLVNATMHFGMSTGNWFTGTTANHTVYAARSVCNTGFTCNDTSLPWYSGTVGSSGQIDVTQLYLNRIANNDWSMWLEFAGESAGNFNDFKDYNPYNSYIAFTWSDAPPAPPIMNPGTPGQVFTDPQVSFQLGTVTNPNGSTPLQYEVQVSTGASGTGTVVDSGLLNATQWTIPDNILQDGSTYWVRARSYDATGAGYSNWSTAVNFKIDLRTGKDKTQTYDTVGPISADLATGNVALSDGSHTSKALGGSLGVSLDYNSPQKARIGLRGQYWNNTTMGGTPVLDRTDQNVNFNWAGGSPSPGVNSDNFSAKWTGYFVAPKTGSYTFGGANDDSFTVIVNGQTVYNNSLCPSGCYSGTAVSLTAGQIVPIEVDYIEYSGYAEAVLLAQGPVPAGTVPSDWLRTDPRPITQTQGLVGRYYYDDGSHNLDSTSKAMFMQRTDPLVSFNWGTDSPVAGGPTDNFMVRYTGYFTAPTTGSYQFGAQSDDGVRITVGTDNTRVLDAWSDHPANTYWGSGYNLSAGQTVPITVDYYEHTSGAMLVLLVQGAVASQTVPAAWLSPSPQVLPAGWQLGIDPDGGLSYDHAKINQNSVVLTDSTGDTHEYTYQNGAYKPPVNEDGQLTRNNDGTLTLQDTDGRTYVFNADGTLGKVTSPVDDRNPAAVQYAYGSANGSPARLTQITDGVNAARWAKVYYSGDSNCGSVPAGYDSAPPGMLCAVATNDGRTTAFYYKNGYLARIAKPGNDYTDYDYDSLGRIISIRDSLANDAIAAGVRANDATVTTQLVYDVLGRITSVTQPAANAGDSRIQHTMQYLPGDSTAGYAGATLEHIVGAAEPNGFSQRVEYDNLFRTTKAIDSAGLATAQVWDNAKDLLYSSTDPAGLTSTTLYDDEDRPISSYGPAPSNYYGSDRKPTDAYLAQVSHTDTAYDQNITGPAVAYYIYDTATKSLSGAPKLHSTNLLGATAGDFNRYFGTAGPITGVSDNWGLTATAKLRLPQAGTYAFRLWSDNGARVYIDDQLVSDDWNDAVQHSHPTFTIANTAGQVHRLRIDYYHRTGDANLTFYLTPPGGSEQWQGINQYLSPDYSLATTTTTYDSTIGNSQTTTNYGANPELGLAQSATADPAGQNLTTANTYEAAGTTGSYLRQLSKTLPGGNATGYSYYSATDTRDNPCTSQTESSLQAGLIRLKTEPDPDGSGPQTPRTTETIYDDAGRIVATRLNADPWTCTTYDARGRVMQTVIPAIKNRTGRTVTVNYLYQGSPFKTYVDDSVVGGSYQEIDLLGRQVTTQDTFSNKYTHVYDNLGRMITQTSPLGTETYSYDNLNRQTAYAVDGVIYATIFYDSLSRIASVVYPQAKDVNNNTLKLEQVKRDSLLRTSGATFRFSNGAAFDETLVKSSSGFVTSQTDVYNGKSVTNTYHYDKMARLIEAVIDKNKYTYDYSAPNPATCNQLSANLNASKNSNRTAYTVTNMLNNQITDQVSYCYDQADRLLSSSNMQIGIPTYDDHGNTTSLNGGGAPITFAYDASDANTSISQGSNRVDYIKDASGTILRKKQYANNVLTKSYRYIADGSILQTCSLIDSNSCVTTDKYLTLPGGLLLTLSLANPQSSQQKVYSIKNFHGDTAITADATGSPTSQVFFYEPFGQPSVSATFGTGSNPQNGSAGSLSWAASPDRISEPFSLFIIQMGSRVYIPSLGRFAQVDPIDGGTLNNYVYAADPINQNDYSGKFIFAIPFVVEVLWAGAAAASAYIIMTNPTVKSAGVSAINTATSAVGNLLKQGFRSVPQVAAPPPGKRPNCRPRVVTNPGEYSQLIKPSASYEYQAMKGLVSDLNKGIVNGQRVISSNKIGDILWRGFSKYQASFQAPDGSSFTFHYMYNEDTCEYGQIKISSRK